MSYQTINLGTPPAATDGDTVRNAMDKVNTIINGINGSLQMGQRPTFGTYTPWDTGNLSGPATLAGTQTFTGANTFSVRPVFNGKTPWDAGNLLNPTSCSTSNSITLDWGTNAAGQLGLTVDTTYVGYLWHSGNLQNPAQTNGATFTSINVPTRALGDSTTNAASTAFVDARVNGVGATSSFAKGALIKRTVIAANTTFVFDSRTTAYLVEGCGGGGAGGGSAIASGAACSAGAGGGSGAWGSAFITGSNFPNVSVTIGAAGAPGSAGSAGGSGGQSSFGSVLVLPGGSGGAAGGAVVSSQALAGGGAGGGAPSGTNVTGSNGNTGDDGVALSATSPKSGRGASCPYGAGGGNVVYNGGASVSNGGNAAGNGAGGGGGAGTNSGVATQGGYGSVGKFIVWEFA